VSVAAVTERPSAPFREAKMMPVDLNVERRDGGVERACRHQAHAVSGGVALLAVIRLHPMYTPNTKYMY
jgi:hypothetical protein